jgi:ferredoxin--NADP+ reductase
VAWYNGHQDFADRVFDLSVERAVVVGNGNVALDLARILTADVDELARTDIADHALDALRASTITEVVVLGRRGPAQAAFTTPELLGLAELDRVDGIDLVVDPAEAELDPLTAAALEAHEMAALKARILRGIAERPPSAAGRRVVLRFLAAPVEILGADCVTGVRIARTRLTEVDGRVVARPTGETEDMDCGLVLRSVGYRGRPLPGLPFDDVRGTLPHDGGRVVDPGTRTPLTGVYAAGWIKRGPSGVIGTNKRCAEETVQALFDDYSAGRLCAPARSADSLHALIAGRRPEALDLGAWNVVDRHERAEGRRQRRPRVKLTSVADVLRVAQEVRAVAG